MVTTDPRAFAFSFSHEFIVPMRSDSWLLATALTASIYPARCWITKSQANFGAQISEIDSQMKGLPSSRFVQAECVSQP